MTEYRWCTTCADERPFENPDCVDGHGGDCFDRSCVDCGEAVVVGVVVAAGEVHAVLVAA